MYDFIDKNFKHALKWGGYCSDLLFPWYLAGYAAGVFLKTCRMAGKSISGPQRIYISRRSRRQEAADFRELVNADEIEDKMRSFGFEILEPEKLSIMDQIGLFSQAKIVVGELCSGLHNTVFSPIGARIVQLNPFNVVQRRLAITLGHSLVSIVPDDGIIRSWPGNPDDNKYTINPSRLIKAAFM